MLRNQQQFLIEKVHAPSFPRNHLGNDMRIDWRNVGLRKHFQTDAISCCFNTEEIIFNSRAQSFHPFSWEECQHEINSCNRKYLHLWTLSLMSWALIEHNRRGLIEWIYIGTSCCDLPLKIVYYGSYSILYFLTIQYSKIPSPRDQILYALGLVCIW